MRESDIVIVGGGLAGSMAAAMLGRAGYHVVLVDPRHPYPPDFRCEKLDASQVHLLQRAGLAEGVLRSATLNEEVWVARFGRLVEKRRTVQYGIAYQALVNAMRSQIPASVAFVHDKATGIVTSADRQTITLSGGDTISARLVILANGLNDGLRRTLGMESREISACHSVSLGFDVVPLGRPAFAFPALTCHLARTDDRIAYLTLFPIGAGMRANLFVYRSLRDPWLRDFRDAPEATLLAALPGLDGLMGAFTVDGAIKIRPVDLSATAGCRQAGIVLVGDAFATSCPAAGTGLNKVFTDVERLCAVHIPRWLRTAGMGQDKIEAFYDDPAKTACDAQSLRKARHLRCLSTEISVPWRVRRWGRSLGHVGAIAVRTTRQRLPMRAPERRGAPFARPAEPRG